MTDMQITVRFRWKAGGDFSVVFVFFKIAVNDLTDKVFRKLVIVSGHVY